MEKKKSQHLVLAKTDKLFWSQFFHMARIRPVSRWVWFNRFFIFHLFSSLTIFDKNLNLKKVRLSVMPISFFTIHLKERILKHLNLFHMKY